MVVVIWTRFMMMLQLTRSFGPILRIILSMVGEVAKFLVIWSIMLICLSSMATLLFGELSEYSEFIEVFFTVFSTGIANYDMNVFDALEASEMLGRIFIAFAVLANCVVLLNFIIAILADTFSKLSMRSLGIYYDGLIARIPVYEDDARYGGLIVGLPPFNVIALLMVPFYCCVKDERTLRNVNNKFTQILFIPIALVFTAIFMAFNLLLLPFAFLAAIYKKL